MIDAESVRKTGILEEVTPVDWPHTRGDAQAPVKLLTEWDVEPAWGTLGNSEVWTQEWDWDEFDRTVEFQRLSSEQVEVRELRGWLQVAESTLRETRGDNQPGDVHKR